MKAKIIFYSQKKIHPKERTKFKKELTGHNDASHGGRYRYRIEGLLDNIDYIKPCNAALIIRNKDYNAIIKIIKRYKLQYDSYNIEVPLSHFKKK